jgi:opacity protein-like surface antigen
MKKILAAAVTAALALPAFAQSVATEVQRNVNQQERIEQGLKSGALTTKEAAKLEKGEARIDKMESNALKDGKLGPNEKARIQEAQNKESAEIAKLKGNERTGNPASASSQRMQADVQRNVNQQQRIEQGVKSGQLTNKETARLEAGQSKVNAKEAKAGADGKVGPREQANIQKAENKQSKKIHHEKHDAQAKAKAP